MLAYGLFCERRWVERMTESESQTIIYLLSTNVGRWRRFEAGLGQRTSAVGDRPDAVTQWKKKHDTTLGFPHPGPLPAVAVLLDQGALRTGIEPYSDGAWQTLT